MATITTSTFLDTATGTRTAGEAWTMNDGAVLTIRTDTRWHAKSPASMTGSIGATSISATQGGGLLIDSTNVRWMPYDTGSGNIPAIGTSITQGAVTGILLGVWANYTSAPSAVGVAMPTTGYLKFREVTGGTFSVGALVGIGANATAPDRQGWIEIVQEQAVANTVPRLGYFRTRGGWFVLDQVTNGVAGQIIQTPTNGGGAGTLTPAVWIESPKIAVTNMTWSNGIVTVTAVDHEWSIPYTANNGLSVNPTIFASISDSTPAGYNIQDAQITIIDKDTFTFQLAVNPGTYVSGANYRGWDMYPAVSTTWFLAENLSTDTRSKFVCLLPNGEIRIGSDGTANAGYVPETGSRIRIPSNIGRQTSSANRALNLVPHATVASRPDWTTTSAGDVDMEYFINDWYYLFSGAFRVRLICNATFDILSTTNIASPMEVDKVTTGAYLAGTISLTMTNNSLGGVITSSRFVRPDAASNGHCISVTGCSNFVFDSVRTGIVQYARSTGNIVFSQCRNFEFNRITTYCAALATATCSNIIIKDFNYIDRIVGITNATTGKYAVQCTISCDNIFVDGVILSNYPNLGPYLGVFNASNCSNLTFRNVGTRTSPVDVNVSAAPSYIFQDGGNNDGVKVQRCYLKATRTSPYLTVNTSKNILIEHCHGTAGSLQTLSINSLIKGVRALNNSVTGGASVYGTHTFDMFTSDTTGRIWWAMNEPTAFSNALVKLTLVGTAGGFTSGGQVSMQSSGDEIIIETPHYILGHTGFANIAPTLTGTNTGNFTYQYDIDVNDGNGFTGTYKTLSGANLSSETVSPSIGFKLKLKIVCTVSSITNALTYVRIDTISTALAQDNLYPLDFTTVNLSGYTLGTRIQIYDLTNSVELYNAIPASTTLSYSAPYTGDVNVRIRAMYVSGKTAKKFVEFVDVLTTAGLARTIDQEDETVYILNDTDGSTVTSVAIDDASLLVNVSTGSIKWADIYAYETYWLGTEEGIRDEGRFIDAIDPANYKLYDFKIKNISSPSEPLLLTNGWAVDGVTGRSIDIIDSSGGTIFSAPDHVVAYETSGSSSGGATASEVWSYSSRTLSSAGVTAIKSDLATQEELMKVKSNTNLIPALL